MEKNESMMSKKSYVFLLALFILLSCEKIDFFSRAYVATVNGEKIYLEEYRYRLNQKMAMLPKDVAANETRYINRLGRRSAGEHDYGKDNAAACEGTQYFGK